MYIEAASFNWTMYENVPLEQQFWLVRSLTVACGFRFMDAGLWCAQQRNTRNQVLVTSAKLEKRLGASA
jgi:hypothetical protein